MRVMAIKPGFYGGSRRRVGDIFEMPDDEAKGTKWVEPAPGSQAEAKARAEALGKADRERFAKGALAASGTTAAAKKKAELDQLV